MPEETAVSTALSAGVSPPTATPEPQDPRLPTVEFAAYSYEPVIHHSSTEAWNMTLAFPGAVVYRDGLFHLFLNELAWWPASVAVFYATSPDGMNWTRMSEEPIFTSDDLNVPYTAFVSSVMVAEDGTWVLYYATVDNKGPWPPPLAGGIGRATAPGPTGPWTADDKLVLEPGEDGAWDAQGVRDACVLQTEEGYLMYFTGFSEKSFASIGMATSADGITWIKHEEPVLVPSSERGTWDQLNVREPRVQLTQDGWVMLYSSSNQIYSKNAGSRLPAAKDGFAVSVDGVNWTRSDEVVISPSRVFEGGISWAKAFVYQDGVYYLLLGSGHLLEGSADWNVYLATYEGSLMP